MRKTLLATSALACAGALAVGSASAADMMSVGVGGYMQQWIGMSSLDGAADEGGVSQYSDSEFNVTGRLEADNGLTFSVKIEVEGDTHADVIDESQATVRGSFGQIVLGSEDDAATIMHYGNKDVGVGLACGDPGFIAGITTCARGNGKGLGTAGHLIGGDSQKIAYYTPRLAGVQFGVSYSPESAEAKIGTGAGGAPLHNDEDAVSVGLNVMQSLGDASVALSLGHYQASQMPTSHPLMSGLVETANVNKTDYKHVTVEQYKDYQTKLEAADKAIATGSAAMDLSGVVEKANDAEKLVVAAQDGSMGKADEQTFTNFGLQVGFGAFAFDVAYAVHDGGAYKVMLDDKTHRVVTGDLWDHDGDSSTDMVAETEARDNPANNRARTVLVKDTSKDYEVASVGVNYTDGPMAVSLSHMMAEADDGSEANATMLSLSYNLAPGVFSRSTLMAGEQDAVQGTAFVTGITIGF